MEELFSLADVNHIESSGYFHQTLLYIKKHFAIQVVKSGRETLIVGQGLSAVLV
jgi:hypothetical protein